MTVGQVERDAEGSPPPPQPQPQPQPQPRPDNVDVEGQVDVTPAGEGQGEGARRLLKLVKKEGEGEELPSAGCVVTVHYTGTLLDGSKFDSSKDRDKPFDFTLGKGQVIKAWDAGVATMKKGEVSVLTCAPELCYGESGSPPKIPPNSWLNFEVEMIDWQGEDLSPKKNNGIVRYTIIPGTSSYDLPSDGALVNIELVGKLYGVKDAKPFESRTVSFYLGEGCENGICNGVERALEKFSMGEKSRLIIQPRYAFKSTGNKELGVPPDAIVEYTVTLKSFDKSDVDSLDYEYVMKQGKTFKDKGTEYFKSAKYVLAVKMYKNAVTYLSKTDLEGEGVSPDVRINLLLSVYLNLALCYLKFTPVNSFEARDNAIEALKIEPNNVKGLFRKGQALQAMGECDEAIEAFQRVIEIEPENKAAVNQITICKSTIKQQNDKEKKLYANMFEKFAQKDTEVIDGKADGEEHTGCDV
ncbi:FK506-binding protein 59-like isoform X2 [Arctopsyche grandis]|uniref:FK506-binding protein 59-like isoform X2 n=1 Tax=Arctopsyche grandis TaxID=121162 RepID=UPI00406D6367